MELRCKRRVRSLNLSTFRTMVREAIRYWGRVGQLRQYRSQELQDHGQESEGVG